MATYTGASSGASASSATPTQQTASPIVTHKTFADGTSADITSLNGVVQSIFSYDASNNVTGFAKVNPDGTGTVYKFDPTSGQTTSATNLDVSGHVASSTRFAYDANGNQTASANFDAAGKVTSTNQFAYDADGNQTIAAAFDGAGKLTASSRFTYDADGIKTGSTTFDVASNTTTESVLDQTNGATLTSTIKDGNTIGTSYGDKSGRVTEYAGGIGQALGSSIGAALGGNSLVARSLAGSVIGDLGSALGQSLAASGAFSTALTAIGIDGTTAVNQGLDSAFVTLGDNLSAGRIIDDVNGALGSLLTVEAAHALGLKGFAAVAFDTIGASVTTQLLKNVATIGALPSGIIGNTPGISEGFGDIGFGTQLASAGGAYLGSLVVKPNGLTGQIGGSIGTYLGTTTAATGAITGELGTLGVTAAFEAIGTGLGSVVPVIGTLIGAFVGDIVGTLIGNLFGSNAPARDQTIAAQVGATFGIVYQDSAHGGWSGQFTDYATGIDTAAGALVAATGGTLSGISGIGNLQFYSNGGDTHVRLVNGQLDGLSADPATYTQAAKDSVLSLAKNAAITGGDAIMTAAFAAATRQDKTIEAFGQDLQVAMDYKTYLANTEAINLAMAASPDSAFTAGWDITLLRAQELGLNQVGDAAGWTAALTTDGTRSVETVKDNNGIVVEQENFAADGSQVDYQYYLNQTVTLSGKTIKVINGATYNVIGSNNTIQSGHDATLNVTGNQNAVTVDGDNTSVAFHGAGNTVTIVNGAVTADANNDVVVTGSNVAVTGGTGAKLTLNGDQFAASVS